MVTGVFFGVASKSGAAVMPGVPALTVTSTCTVEVVQVAWFGLAMHTL